jgi:hypothetical protein
LPEPLFEGCIPALKTITLMDVSTSSLNSFGNLTSIVLRSRLSNVLVLSTFLDLLRRCPLLQCLEISSYNFRREEENGGTVALPALTKLSLTNTRSCLILSHIDTPALSNFEICSVSSTGPFSENMERLSITKQIQALHINQQPASSFHYNSISGFNTAGSICFQVDGIPALGSHIERLSRASLENCTQLRIDWENEKPLLAATMTNLLSSAYALKMLRLERPSCRRISSATHG